MMRRMIRGWVVVVMLVVGVGARVDAQVRTIDPNAASGLAVGAAPAYTPPATMPVDHSQSADPVPDAPPPPSRQQDSVPAPPAQDSGGAGIAGTPMGAAASRASSGGTYQDKDVFDAAEGVFGKGAEGLAKLIEKIIGDHGRPNAYIAGREAGGAFMLGVRYGSGTLFHKVEGERPVYWTGPSIGFDVGANGSKTFVLVYNLYDTQDLYHRFPAGEGSAYFVGGFTASYMRRGDVVLIPIRLGVGWRLGVNGGYMNFTEKSRWLPF